MSQSKKMFLAGPFKSLVDSKTGIISLTQAVKIGFSEL